MSKIKMNDILYCQSKCSLYDENSIESIFRYAQKIENKTLIQILKEANLSNEQIEWVQSKEVDRGLPGKIIEGAYFGYELNSRQEADFNKVGLELKTTPADYSKKEKKFISGETLSITQIDFSHKVIDNFFDSHLWHKLQFLLIIFYWRDKQLKSKLYYQVLFASLFKPSEEDLIIIQNDYSIINQKIKSGQADKLSRSDGLYLSTAPKATGNSKYVQSIYGGKELIRRCYTLRKPYIQVILDGYNFRNSKEERIVKNIEELKHNSFEFILQERFSKYINKNIYDIAKELDYEIKFVKNKDNKESLSKAVMPSLTAKMLGVTKLNSEEFLKAGIVVKTITFDLKGNNKEQFRLNDANFFEINDCPDTYKGFSIDEKGDEIEVEYSGWEESVLYNSLENLRYLFIVFKETVNGIVFKGSRLWSMSDDDIELAHKDWLDIKKVIREGVIFTRVQKGSVEITENNFPGMKEARRIHLRPHSKKSFYVDNNGNSWGNGSVSDTVQLPDGQRMVKQSYWLKNSFVQQFVSDLLF